ncbi:MAG TPA: hypothetical protein VKQ08_09165, partial [Cyclobacteriaceae bacterium]|nr:hypothetical protein [Cyclobacteriaceae bacterium]
PNSPSSTFPSLPSAGSPFCLEAPGFQDSCVSSLARTFSTSSMKLFLKKSAFFKMNTQLIFLPNINSKTKSEILS